MNAKVFVLLCAPLFATGLTAQHTTQRPDQPDSGPMAAAPPSVEEARALSGLPIPQREQL